MSSSGNGMDNELRYHNFKKEEKLIKYKGNEIGTDVVELDATCKKDACRNAPNKCFKLVKNCQQNKFCSHRRELKNLLPLLKKHLVYLLQKQAEEEEAVSNYEDVMICDDEHKSNVPSKYPKRSIARKNYKEEEVSDDDDYLYCDDCEKEYKCQCPIHEPLHFIPNRKIPRDGSVPNRAFSTIPEFLSLGISRIKGAGCGIWAEVDLPKGLAFGPYEGSVVSSYKEAHKSGYCWQIKKRGRTDHYIEAGDVATSNWMRFVNCAKTENMQNLVAFQYKGQIYYRTYKPVLKFCELLVWYGNSYAKDLDIDLQDDDVTVVNDTVGYDCDRCHLSFTSEQYLKRHMKWHGDRSSAFRHKCQFCLYSSNHLSHLEHHLLTHTGEKPHTCSQCGRGFSQKGHLHEHLRVHSKEKPYQCDQCGKSFTVASNLKRHKRIHFREKPFRCNICSKAFSQAIFLIRHQRTHAGQKPYKCPHCNYRFTGSSDLNRHVVAKHTRNFPHRCPSCEKGFPCPKYLREHKQKHHGKGEELNKHAFITTMLLLIFSGLFFS